MKQGIGLKTKMDVYFGFKLCLIDQRCLALPTTRASVSMTL
jgi:hypothetical protein